jgi:hypothetical protein
MDVSANSRDINSCYWNLSQFHFSLISTKSSLGALGPTQLRLGISRDRPYTIRNSSENCLFVHLPRIPLLSGDGGLQFLVNPKMFPFNFLERTDPQNNKKKRSKNRWNIKVLFFSNFRSVWRRYDWPAGSEKIKVDSVAQIPTLDFCTSFGWSTLTNLSVCPTLSLNVFAEVRYWFKLPWKIDLTKFKWMLYVLKGEEAYFFTFFDVFKLFRVEFKVRFRSIFNLR